MYVAQAASGKGIGKLLIREVIERARALGDIEQINLTVVAANERAAGLYESFGFETFSIEKNAIKYNGKYFDEKNDGFVFMNVDERSYREKVYEIVRQIPRGRVMTYGQIAAILGEGYTPRTVGYVMHAAETENVPWQRVINSQGSCSTGKMTIPVNLQQKMLEDEGVIFNEKGRCDLSQYQWFPEGYAPPEDEQPSLFG